MKRRIELELTDHEIEQLRQVIDWLPLARYATLICAVLPKLPLTESEAVPSRGPDAPPVSSPYGTGAGFSITAFTPKGKAMLAHIQKVLGRVEVSSDEYEGLPR